MKNPYGYFSEDGKEFTVTDPKTPRAFDNFLWNDAVFSNIQQTGTGYCDYQVGDQEAVQLLTGVGRICDFDVFGRDHLMSRLIYIRDNETGEFWNVNWEPVCKPYESYRCTHGLGYSTIETTVNGIQSEFRIFIPQGKDPVELWNLHTSNPTQKTRKLSIFVYNQFQFKYKWGFDSYGDMIFRNSLFDASINAVVASKHPHKKPHEFLNGFITSDEPITAYDGSRDAFIGTYGSLNQPEAVVKGQCTNTPGSSDATIGTVQFNVELAPGEKKSIAMMLGAADTAHTIAALKEKYLNNQETYFSELQQSKQELFDKVQINTPDSYLNVLLNQWIKQGSVYGATWCRWGWNGYRDIVQHGFGVVSYKPERTREILLEAFKYQYSTGLALRGWNPVDEKSYSDSALWLVFTLTAYIRETGDTGILSEAVPYYDNGSGTVLEHINRALNFLETNKGEHGICLIKFGDWNDSLTAVGKEGKGESVWLSEAYAEALQQMAQLAEFMKEDGKAQDYSTRYRKIKEALNAHAWDGQWYKRCFDDKGQPIGSKENAQGKIFIEAQSWALIAGVADDERSKQLIQACDELLLTDLGYMLLSPTFKYRDDSIGRISCLEPGICENGTIYFHTNAWMIMGLLKKRMPDRAYELFKRIMPGYIETENSPKENCPPYMTANCYYGPEHRSRKFQMEFTWITGSLGWYHNVIMEEMLGIKADYDGLQIDPVIPADWESYEVTREFRNAGYHIVIKNPDKIPFGKVEVTVDGKPISGNKLPLFTDEKVHEIIAVIQSK